MKTYAEQRTMLARMVRARAECMTISTRVKARSFGRASATWTCADERSFRANVAVLHFERRDEIETLNRKFRAIVEGRS